MQSKANPQLLLVVLSVSEGTKGLIYRGVRPSSIPKSSMSRVSETDMADWC